MSVPVDIVVCATYHSVRMNLESSERRLKEICDWLSRYFSGEIGKDTESFLFENNTSIAYNIEWKILRERVDQLREQLHDLKKIADAGNFSLSMY